VQGEIEDILKQIHKESISINASGRTDAFVHALEQTFSFKSKKIKLKPNILLQALRNLSPDDIYFKSVREVDGMFHARFSAHSKIYKYEIDTKHYDVFKNNYVLFYPHKINLQLMKQATKLLIGKHDFKSFSTSDLEDTIREVYQINLKHTNNHLTITVKANGFLRNMVRMLVGTLLDINEHKKQLSDINQLLNSPKKGSSISKAKACGLYLYKVNY
jgi:tRNA pseudouridine38-40 synthase